MQTYFCYGILKLNLKFRYGMEIWSTYLVLYQNFEWNRETFSVRPSLKFHLFCSMEPSVREFDSHLAVFFGMFMTGFFGVLWWH